jgi:hypothetical protein
MRGRVHESVKSSQRLMAVALNFIHLKDAPDDKITALSELGITHLLELKQLPDRFRKAATATISGEPEILNVIDEDKLTNFLNKSVVKDGKVQQVKYMSVKRMKDEIQNESGSSITRDGKDKDNDAKKTTPLFNTSSTLVDAILSFNTLANSIRDRLDNIDDAFMYEQPEDAKQMLKDGLTQTESLCSALIIKSREKRDKLRG